MTLEERAQAILETFQFGPGLRYSWGMVEDVANAIRAAVEAEREACAKVAELYATGNAAAMQDRHSSHAIEELGACRDECMKVAAAIRARKDSQ